MQCVSEWIVRFHRQINRRLKGKGIPVQAWTGTKGSRRSRLPEGLDNRHMKVAKLSALRTGLFFPPRRDPSYSFFKRLIRPQGHSVAGRITSMKNPNDTIENRTRNTLACSAVPHPTALSRAWIHTLRTRDVILHTEIYRVCQEVWSCKLRIIRGGQDYQWRRLVEVNRHLYLIQ